MSPLLTMLATAALAAVMTLGLAAIAWRGWLAPAFERRLAAAVETAKAELRAELETASRDLGEEIERRVRRGVIDGVAAIPSSEVVQGATRTVARTGAEILGAGLETLLGRDRRR